MENYVVRTSARRTKTMTAFREDGRLVVVVPQRMTRRQREELIPPLVESFLAKEEHRRAPRGDDDLTRRLTDVYDRYLAPVADAPTPVVGVRWVSNMRARWGSCTPSTGEIRISDRLRDVPTWVLDYVLLHEATHLVESGHTARFHALVARYPLAEKASGFLEGMSYASGRPASMED